MTTIITIVVVALVFFVTVCVVGFMVWKREAEMRTDSIRSIEYNVEEMLHELTGGSSRDIRNRDRRDEDYRSEQHHTQQEAIGIAEKSDRRAPAQQQTESFGWVRAESGREEKGSREEYADAAQKARENITVFEPDAMQYASFDTKGHDPSERDGRRGLRWKEVEKPARSAGAEEAAEASEAPQAPELTQPEVPEEMPEIQLPDLSAQPESGQAGEAAAGSFHEPDREAEPEPAGETASVPAPEEDRNEGGKLSKLFKKHKKDKPEDPGRQEEPDRRDETNRFEEPDHLEDAAEKPPAEEWGAKTVEDLLEEYIGSSETFYEEYDQELDSEMDLPAPARPGYNVGKSGRKYTAAELEALIKE